MFRGFGGSTILRPTMTHPHDDSKDWKLMEIVYSFFSKWFGRLGQLGSNISFQGPGILNEFHLKAQNWCSVVQGPCLAGRTATHFWFFWQGTDKVRKQTWGGNKHWNVNICSPIIYVLLTTWFAMFSAQRCHRRTMTKNAICHSTHQDWKPSWVFKHPVALISSHWQLLHLNHHGNRTFQSLVLSNHPWMGCKYATSICSWVKMCHLPHITTSK